MSGRYAQNAGVVSAAHALLILALLALPGVRGCHEPLDPTIVPVDFIVEHPGRGSPTPPDIAAPPPAAPPAPAPAAPEAAPEPEAVPEPKAAPEPEIVAPKDPTAPAPKPVRKSVPIEVSRKKIVHKVGGAASSSATSSRRSRTYSQSDIQNMLGYDPTATRPGPAAGNEDSRALALVRRVMYYAWEQPVTLGIEGLTVDVMLRLRPDGSIADYKLQRPSGQAAMDESVLAAVKSVPRIEGLSPDFIRRYPTITVVFELRTHGESNP